eukprot:m.245509 g.245509  ORF g.245509 m.245509 type:complete len:317 (+) comp10958_c0_seq2:711-1661(+)
MARRSVVAALTALRKAAGRRFSTVKPAKVGPPGVVPPHIVVPSYVLGGKVPVAYRGAIPRVTGEDALARLRASCQLAAEMLAFAEQLVAPGVTTEDLDRQIHAAIIEAGAYPSPLGYCGYPKSICTSVNNVVVHGIPDSRPLEEGDIINVDITVFLNGFHGDNSQTFVVGQVDPAAKALIEDTNLAMNTAIAACGPNVPFNVIGDAVTRVATEKRRSIVDAFVGHGIGEHFHVPPEILHHRNDDHRRMQPGMVFTIEPILSEGSPSITILEDRWTAVSDDNSRSAQAEHTLLITADVRTQAEGGASKRMKVGWGLL